MSAQRISQIVGHVVSTKTEDSEAMLGANSTAGSGKKLTKLSRSIRGKVAIVTGAASGQGRATAHLFADEGAKVAVVDIGQERVQAVVNEIQASYGPDAAIGLVCDVSDKERIKWVVEQTVKKWGGIDILVNNAGVSMGGGADTDEETFEKNWQKTVDINLTALARFIRAALPYLLKSPEGGRVVNIASTEALVTTAGNVAYTATKAGVIGISRAFAVELGRKGVTFNTILPGPIRTGMTERITEEQKGTYARRRVPLRRYGEPEEVAHGTLALVLPSASYMNGAVLTVDGGMVIRHT